MNLTQVILKCLHPSINGIWRSKFAELGLILFVALGSEFRCKFLYSSGQV